MLAFSEIELLLNAKIGWASCIENTKIKSQTLTKQYFIIKKKVIKGVSSFASAWSSPYYFQFWLENLLLHWVYLWLFLPLFHTRWNCWLYHFPGACFIRKKKNPTQVHELCSLNATISSLHITCTMYFSHKCVSYSQSTVYNVLEKLTELF